MGNNKLLTELSEEDLLNLVDSTEEIETKDKIQEFCSVFNLQTGNKKVNFNTIIKLYKKWDKDSPVVLRHLFEKYFTFDNQYILLDKDPIEIEKIKKIKFKSRVYDKLKNNKYHTHFNKFLNIHKIEKGTIWVPSYLVTFLYNKWTYETKPRLNLNESHLIKFFKFYFSYKFDDIYYFKLNESFLTNFTKESIDNLKASYDKKKKK